MMDASSFPDVDTATDAINEVFTARKKEIGEWLNRVDVHVGECADFKVIDLGREIGYGVRSDCICKTPRYGALVRLVKVSDNPKDDVLLLTAYPINARRGSLFGTKIRLVKVPGKDEPIADFSDLYARFELNTQITEYGLDERYRYGFSSLLSHIGANVEDAVDDETAIVIAGDSEDAEDGLKWGEQENVRSVREYVNILSPERLLLTIKHGLEILALEEFPYERIIEATNKYCKSPQAYCDWIKDLVRILEDEVVKSGKVTAEDVQLLHEGRLDVIVDPDQCRVVRK